MRKRIGGYSLLELVVAIAIIMLLLAAGVYVYTKFLQGTFTEEEATEKRIEKLVSLEIMRLDLEHVGYGVGKSKDYEYRIYDFDNENKTLTIHSTLNNGDNKTIGWKLCDVQKDGTSVVKNVEEDNSNFVFVNSDGFVVDITTTDDCPSDEYGIYVGYPFSDKAVACKYEKDDKEYYFCTEIVYYLSNSNLPKKCNPNTYNLLRKVNNANGGDPLLSCVADIKYTVDLDTDADGEVDTVLDTNTSSLTGDQLRGYTKKINVYILYQEAYSPNEVFQADGSDSKGNYLERDGIRLYLPDNYQNYRWKIIKLSVKPMSIIK
jgi:type IV pilus assembly protein PilW